MQQANQEYEEFLTSLPTIEIPPPRKPSQAEIERRRAHFERTMKHRACLPPLGMSSDELVHLARASRDAVDE